MKSSPERSAVPHLMGGHPQGAVTCDVICVSVTAYSSNFTRIQYIIFYLLGLCSKTSSLRKILLEIYIIHITYQHRLKSSSERKHSLFGIQLRICYSESQYSHWVFRGRLEKCDQLLIRISVVHSKAGIRLALKNEIED